MNAFVPEVVEKRQPSNFFRTWLRRPNLARRDSVAKALLPRLPHLIRYEADYRNLEVIEPPKKPQDCVLVIVECLRADGITPESAPNLTAFAERSLNCTAHFSSGNSSGPGAFGLLFGTESVCYPAGAIARWPAALPKLLGKLLGQCGYHRVFLGSGIYDIYHNMRSWIEPEFELFDEGVSNPFYIRDAKLIDTAVDVLNRRGRFAATDDRAVFVVLYLYTTHFPNEAVPEDFVFTGPGQAPDPPWSSPDDISGYYLNSIHTVDRLLQPILDSDAMVVVTGDHGQSFGEDGSVLHGGEITVVRSHTPMMIAIPGEAPEFIQTLTTHSDLLPTVIDAMGITLNDDSVLTGISMLGLRSEDVVRRGRVIVSNGLECGWFPRETSFDLPVEAPTMFRGDLWTGSIEVPSESFDVFDEWLSEFIVVAKDSTPQDGAAELMKIAQSASGPVRLRALQFLAEFPEYAIPHRHTLRKLMHASNREVGNASAQVESAIEGLLEK